MAAETQFWVALPGSTEQALGPFGLDDVAARVNAGTIPKTATACKVGETNWVPVQGIMPKPALKFGSRVKAIVLGVVGLLVIAVGATVAVKTLATKRKALPIVAQKLPPKPRRSFSRGCAPICTRLPPCRRATSRRLWRQKPVAAGT